MTVILLPRLGQIAVDRILDEIGDDLSASASLDYVSQSPETYSFAASGGSPLGKTDLRDIRQILVDAANRYGFPDRGSTKDRAEFDNDATEMLGQHPLFVPPEALRDDVWAFITTVVAPDIVNWRFGNTARERFHGGVRNAFQRLWMRAWSLDRGQEAEDRWGLIRELTEDAFVQIVERPSVGGDRRIARALAEGWVRMSGTAGRGAMEAIMRRAVIALRLRNQIQMLAALDDAALNASVDTAFELARESLSLVSSEAPMEVSCSSKPNAENNVPGELSKNGPESITTPGKGALSRLRSLIAKRSDSSNEKPGAAVEASRGAEVQPEPFESAPANRPRGRRDRIENPLHEAMAGSSVRSDPRDPDGLFEKLAAVAPDTSLGAIPRDTDPKVEAPARGGDQELVAQAPEPEDLAAQARRIEVAANSRNLLSEKSLAALAKLKSGDYHLSASDRNSLENLRTNLERLGVRFSIPTGATEEMTGNGDQGGEVGSGILVLGADNAVETVSGNGDGGGLVWNEISLPELTDVSMRYRGNRYGAQIIRGKIVDSDGEFSPSEWARKVANGTSRNAWRDLWFKRPGQQRWVLADELRRQTKDS